MLNQVTGEKFHLELNGFLGEKEHTRSIPLAADFTKPQFLPLAGDVGLQQLLESTAVKARILLLAAGNRQPVSGWRWVENIDVDGQSVRIARAIRDARENPAKFAELLQALTERDDVNRLIDFLSNCSIRLEGFSPRSRSPFRPPAGEFTLGPHVRQACNNLREAVQVFFERHRRKLQRHVEEPDPAAAANFSHILETVTRVFNYHLDYEIALLSRETIISADQWKEFRAQAAAVFSRFEVLLQCLTDYCDGLPRRRRLPVLAECFQTMNSTWDSLRQHLEEYITKVKATAKVRTDQGMLVEPPIFANDIFNSTKWTALASRVGHIFDRCQPARNLT